MPSRADPVADRRREPEDFAGFADLVVELPEACAGLNPGCLVGHVDIDVAEVKHVEDGERNTGDRSNALEVMASATDSDLEVLASGAKNCRSDVRYAFGFYDG